MLILASIILIVEVVLMSAIVVLLQRRRAARQAVLAVQQTATIPPIAPPPAPVAHPVTRVPVDEYLARDQVFYNAVLNVYLHRDGKTVQESAVELFHIASPWLNNATAPLLTPVAAAPAAYLYTPSTNPAVDPLEDDMADLFEVIATNTPLNKPTAPATH